MDFALALVSLALANLEFGVVFARMYIITIPYGLIHTGNTK